MPGAKEALVKGNQLCALQCILLLSFWTTHYLSILGVYRVCDVVMGVASVRANLPCFHMVEWGTIIPVLQCNAQHTGCASVSACCVT